MKNGTPTEVYVPIDVRGPGNELKYVCFIRPEYTYEKDFPFLGYSKTLFANFTDTPDSWDDSPNDEKSRRYKSIKI